MARVRYGPVVVDGDGELIALVEKALARTTFDFAKYLDSDVLIRAGETILVPGTEVRAYADFRGDTITIRPDQVRRARGQYLVIHELGHAVDRQHLSGIKRDELMALMSPRPETWRSGATYYWVPAEVFAETFVTAYSDITYTLGIYQRKISELGAFRKITSRPNVDMFLRSVMTVESGGNLFAQDPRSGASALFGFMPRNWTLTAPRVLGTDPAVADAWMRNPDGTLMLDEEGGAIWSPSQNWVPQVTALSAWQVARSEAKRLARRFDEDFQKMACAWRNGEGVVEGFGPVSEWSKDPELRGEIKYTNSVCVPLGYAAIPLPEVRKVQGLVGIKDGEVGRVAAGTPYFHPETLEKIGAFAVDSAAATLIGATPDGKYRGIAAQASRVPGSNPKELVLVKAEAVTDVRVVVVAADPEQLRLAVEAASRLGGELAAAVERVRVLEDYIRQGQGLVSA